MQWDGMERIYGISWVFGVFRTMLRSENDLHAGAISAKATPCMGTLN
jgi:hypothetical protein